MFQNLANYLLGTVSNQEPNEPAEGVENNNLRLTSSEDDWVLVDRDSEGNSEVSSSSMESLIEDIYDDVDIKNSEFLHDVVKQNLPLTSPIAAALLTRTSSTSSLPCTSNMEESWFLTPPPCFISTGPVHMETSPLENLLIEHPSMSVYTHHGGKRHNLMTTTVPIKTVSAAVPEVVHEEENVGQQIVVVRRQLHEPHNNRSHVLHQQERQGFKSKQAQKVQIQKACQAMKRGYLERNNKAREVNSRNRRQRRGERSQGANRSYANNNRKC